MTWVEGRLNLDAGHGILLAWLHGEMTMRTDVELIFVTTKRVDWVRESGLVGRLVGE